MGALSLLLRYCLVGQVLENPRPGEWLGHQVERRPVACGWEAECLLEHAYWIWPRDGHKIKFPLVKPLNLGDFIITSSLTLTAFIKICIN